MSKRALFVGSVLLLAAGLKISLIYWEAIPFNADEAIVALMGRHILAGERPFYFYGQSYMGSLDAFLVSVAFAVFGLHVWAIHLVQTMLYLGTIITTYWIGQSAFGSRKTGLLAALLLSVPSVNMTLYTTASLGGYGETLLLGNSILLLGVWIYKDIIGMWHRPAASRRYSLQIMNFLLTGFCIGCGLWVNWLTMCYTLPTVILMIWTLARDAQHSRSLMRQMPLPKEGLGSPTQPRPRRELGFHWLRRLVRRRIVYVRMLAFGGGLLVGTSPWWVYLVINRQDSFLENLLSSAVQSHGLWFNQIGHHALYLVLFGFTVIFGLRPPWDVRLLAMPLLPLALAFWIGVVWFFISQVIKTHTQRWVYLLLGGVVMVNLAGFVLMPFGTDPSGRYFLPITIPLSLVAAQLARRIGSLLAGKLRKYSGNPDLWAGLFLGIIIIYNILGISECALNYPPGLTTYFDGQTRHDNRYIPELMVFLMNEGETRGYTNYWLAYPLAFLSEERLIYSPRLPYHRDMSYTEKDIRYLPYSEQVDASRKVAYISVKNPELDREITRRFKALGITWLEKQLGDFRVYYRLSEPVRPWEIGLGVSTPPQP